jgi:hypothetical protein
MHTDENKRYDKRNIASNLQRGLVTAKEYETYLSKLPDASDKVFNPDEERPENEEDLGGGDDPGSASKKAVPPGGRG